ncbi:hypothetical protein FEM03_10000 [Phragmitibacter flavus]|uniref:Uncharacterized protein n=2 Tax=Phragmitibacter flavus TaxID=2576071 RepID=A0A5R8KEA8_9BACT|nr:hypothetical protein FEM03_10000 [Phragmitibacter flavus]
MLPQNRVACIGKIREAFDSCPRPTPELLSPNGGIDGPFVHKNWGHLTRDDVEALEFFGHSLGEDITYMSSVAFRYFVPSVMILFLSRPDSIDFGGFISMVSRCESAFQCRADGYTYGQIAMTRPQAEAFREWFGQLMTIIRKFDLGSFEDEYKGRLRALRSRAKTFTPDTDYDASTIQAIRRR